jgi:hypothetical protein
MTDENDIVTAQSFATLQDAEVARTFLESHGIAAFVPDQSARYVTFGPVRLQVKIEDLAEAQKLLASPPPSEASDGG